MAIPEAHTGPYRNHIEGSYRPWDNNTDYDMASGISVG